MTELNMTTELTPDGIICNVYCIGKIATISKVGENWQVYPYHFPPSERLGYFKSLQAAEQYALALAYEKLELSKGFLS